MTVEYSKNNACPSGDRRWEDNMEYYGTLGPACCRQDTLKKMLENGMTGIRLNLSHTSLKESALWIQNYFRAAREVNCKPRFMIDLMGPELRIGKLKKELELKKGQQLILGEEGIPMPKEALLKLSPGQLILLDDGKIQMTVQKTRCDGRWGARVLRGGKLTSKKSIALPGCHVETPVLTKQDFCNLSDAVKYGVTDVMLPFVRNAQDLICLRETLRSLGCGRLRVFAKIENIQGVRHLEELIPHCDYMVVARGDLGNAVPLSKLPCVQDYIAEVCRNGSRKFLIVTQMLNSMMEHPYPTRAEVSDIYHAVKQGASAVMLTGETAQGKYPAEAIKVLRETGESAQGYLREKNWMQEFIEENTESSVGEDR